MLHNLGLDLISDGPFQILSEAELDRSPALLHLGTLRFWKVVQRVKLSYNIGRDAPHPDEALLLIKPCNQGGLIVTPDSPNSPWGSQVCRGCHIHIHGPGRCPQVAFLQLGSLSGADATLSTLLNSYIYSGAECVSRCACARRLP